MKYTPIQIYIATTLDVPRALKQIVSEAQFTILKLIKPKEMSETKIQNCIVLYNPSNGTNEIGLR